MDNLVVVTFSFRFSVLLCELLSDVFGFRSCKSQLMFWLKHVNTYSIIFIAPLVILRPFIMYFLEYVLHMTLYHESAIRCTGYL